MVSVQRASKTTCSISWNGLEVVKRGHGEANLGVTAAAAGPVCGVATLASVEVTESLAVQGG